MEASHSGLVRWLGKLVTRKGSRVRISPLPPQAHLWIIINERTMAKSQLNNLSKRQILESLMYEQNQSNATLSRLITATARAVGLDPEKLAEAFVDDKANQEFVEKFNAGVKAKHTELHPTGDHNHGETKVEPTADDAI